MHKMTDEEWQTFVMVGTRTAKLATTRKNGSPHCVPVWFVLDEGELVFMTGDSTVKAKNIQRDPRVVLTIDEEVFPYAFVMMEGEATILAPSPEELLPISTHIARRYVGDERAEAFGKRNAVEGERLIRVKPTKVIALAGLAD